MKKFFTFLFFLFLQMISLQDISALKITEIMFNPTGSDANREWVEVFNDTSGVINFADYKFNEANVDHRIAEVGDINLNSSEYAVVVQNVEKFKTDFPNYNGKIFTSSFSLLNTGELLQFKDSSGNVLDSVNYGGVTISEGQTWQTSNGNFVGASPNPGTGSQTVTENTNTNNASTTTATTTTTVATSTNASTTTTNTSNTNTIFTPIYSLLRDVIEPPKVYAYAGQNKIVLKNIEIEFSGKIFDENKKEFRSGDFYWSFGDGIFSREKNVRKVFKKEGEYTVILEVRWNDIVDTDKIYIKVINPEVNIKIESGAINIYNNSNDEIDLGNFILKREDNMMKTFVLPKNFSILPSRSINLESSVTNFGEDIQRVGIYYPSNVLLKMYPETISNKTESIFVNDNIATTSSISAYTLKDFQMLQKGDLLQGVATSSGAKLASPISLPKFKKKTVYKNNFTPKIATNTNQVMTSISASADNSIVANNKIILEKPKSFFQNFKESLGF